MKIGFTGTRKGMFEVQREALTTLLKKFFRADAEFHHGDCDGADDEAAFIAHEIGFSIVCHPPVDEKYRAFNPHSSDTREAKTHFARNRDIVDETEILIAAPCDMTDQPKGGTWYTVGYAKKKDKVNYIVWPDGRVEVRNLPF